MVTSTSDTGTGAITSGRQNHSGTTLVTTAVIIVWVIIAWSTLMIGLSNYELYEQDATEAALLSPPDVKPDRR